jgi:hypothetical protein
LLAFLLLLAYLLFQLSYVRKVSDDGTFALLQLDRYLFCIKVLSEYKNWPAIEKISDYRIKVSIYRTIACFKKLSVAHLCLKGNTLPSVHTCTFYACVQYDLSSMCLNFTRMSVYFFMLKVTILTQLFWFQESAHHSNEPQGTSIFYYECYLLDEYYAESL